MKYYKVKHENVSGKAKSLVDREEINTILDRILELEGNNKEMDKFDTEKNFFEWLEGEYDKITNRLEAGERIDFGDYDLIQEEEV